MKLGAEPKKLAALGGLLVFLVAWLIYQNVSSDEPSTPARPTAPRGVAGLPAPDVSRTPNRPGRDRTGRLVANDFGRTMKRKPGEAAPDLERTDPTLRLDLLARVQAIAPEKAGRNLFELGAAPAAPGPAAPLGPPVIIKPTNPFIAQRRLGPEPPAPPPPPPTAPPIPLKFYGYVAQAKQGGPKRAFLLDGEDILVANEGDTIKGRYKLVRVGLNSIVMEDTQFHQQQTINLEPEAANG